MAPRNLLALDAPMLDPGNPLTAGAPSWADSWQFNAQAAQDWVDQQRAISAQRGLWDAAGMTPAGARDMGGQLANALLMGTTAPGFRAFHGSPHSFDRFDTSKIGTGEGAQAYGHGLYFADSEGVAKSYRDSLTGQGGLTPGSSRGIHNFAVNGQYPPEGMAGHRAMDTAIDLNGLLSYMHMYENKPSMSVFWKRGDPIDPRYDARGSYQQSMDYLRGQIERRIDLHRTEVGSEQPNGIAQRDMHELANFYDKHVRNAEPSDVTARPPGSMYEVQVNADPAHFLDWDKPLSEQSQHVRDALQIHKDLGGRQNWDDRATGAQVYKQITGDRIEAASQLRWLGIPGIRYLDQGSRASGEGTYNHVIFDANTIEILRKYGIAGLMAGGGAATAALGRGTNEADQ